MNERHDRHWNDVEKGCLRRLVERGDTDHAIGFVLGRTERAVKLQRISMGIYKEKPIGVMTGKPMFEDVTKLEARSIDKGKSAPFRISRETSFGIGSRLLAEA